MIVASVVLPRPGGLLEEEDVVEGFAAGAGGFERDGQLLLGFRLADELGEPGRPKF